MKSITIILVVAVFAVMASLVTSEKVFCNGKYCQSNVKYISPIESMFKQKKYITFECNNTECKQKNSSMYDTLIGICYLIGMVLSLSNLDWFLYKPKETINEEIDLIGNYLKKIQSKTHKSKEEKKMLLRNGMSIYKVRLNLEKYKYNSAFKQPFVFANSKKFKIGVSKMDDMMMANPNDYDWVKYKGTYYLMNVRGIEFFGEEYHANPEDYMMRDFDSAGIMIYKKRDKPNDGISVSCQSDPEDASFDPIDYAMIKTCDGYKYLKYSEIEKQRKLTLKSIYSYCNDIFIPILKKMEAGSFKSYVFEAKENYNQVLRLIIKNYENVDLNHFEDYQHAIWTELVSPHLFELFSKTKPEEYFWNPSDFILTESKTKPFLLKSKYMKELNCFSEELDIQIDRFVMKSNKLVEKALTLSYYDFSNCIENDVVELAYDIIHDFELSIKQSDINQIINIKLFNIDSYYLHDDLRKTYCSYECVNGEIIYVTKDDYANMCKQFKADMQNNLSASKACEFVNTDLYFDDFLEAVLEKMKCNVLLNIVYNGTHRKENYYSVNLVKQFLRNIGNKYIYEYYDQIKYYYESNQNEEYYLDPVMFKGVMTPSGYKIAPKFAVINLSFVKLNKLPYLDELKEYFDEKINKQTEKMVKEMIDLLLHDALVEIMKEEERHDPIVEKQVQFAFNIDEIIDAESLECSSTTIETASLDDDEIYESDWDEETDYDESDYDEEDYDEDWDECDYDEEDYEEVVEGRASNYMGYNDHEAEIMCAANEEINRMFKIQSDQSHAKIDEEIKKYTEERQRAVPAIASADFDVL